MAHKGFEEFTPFHGGKDTNNFLCIDRAFEIYKIKAAKKDGQSRGLCNDAKTKTAVLFII